MVEHMIKVLGAKSMLEDGGREEEAVVVGVEEIQGLLGGEKGVDGIRLEDGEVCVEDDTNAGVGDEVKEIRNMSIGVGGSRLDLGFKVKEDLVREEAAAVNGRMQALW